MRAELEAYGRSLDVTFPEGDHLGKWFQMGQWYERDLLEDIYGRIPHHSMALDVGAHIGNHTLWLAAICGLQVVAIEPNPNSMGFLQANVARNGLAHEVNSIEAAAGSEVGKGRLEFGSENNSGMTRLVPDAAGSVEVMTVDSLGLESLAVMKIDVEGSELAVLEGSRETITAYHPFIYVETEAGSAADRWLIAAGYESFGRFCITPTWGYLHRRAE